MSTRHPEPPAKRSMPRSSVFLYAGILFSAAFVLVMLSYFSQERTRNQEQLAIESANAQSASRSLEQLYRANQELTEQVEALEGKLTDAVTAADERSRSIDALMTEVGRLTGDLKAQEEESQRVLTALTTLLQLVSMDREANPDEFQAALDALVVSDLPPAAYSVYNAFRASLNQEEAGDPAS